MSLFHLEFMECAACKAQSGAAQLCSACLHNRMVVSVMRHALDRVRDNLRFGCSGDSDTISLYAEGVLQRLDVSLSPDPRCSTKKLVCMDIECPRHGR